MEIVLRNRHVKIIRHYPAVTVSTTMELQIDCFPNVIKGTVVTKGGKQRTNSRVK